MKITESVFRGHPNLSVNKPQIMSRARIRGFTPQNDGSSLLQILAPEVINTPLSANHISKCIIGLL